MTTYGDVWESLDYSDPAALLAQLRPVYYRLVAGQAESELEGADRRRLRFQQADMGRLEKLIAKLEADVARIEGKPRRFALVGRMR